MPAPHPTTVAVNGYTVGALRTLTGTSRSDLARELVVDVSYLSKIENGQRPRLSPTTFAALARFFASHGVDRRALLAQPSTDLLEQAS